MTQAIGLSVCRGSSLLVSSAPRGDGLDSLLLAQTALSPVFLSLDTGSWQCHSSLCFCLWLLPGPQDSMLVLWVWLSVDTPREEAGKANREGGFGLHWHRTADACERNFPSRQQASVEQNEQVVVRKRSVWGLLSNSLDIWGRDSKLQKDKGLGTTHQNNPSCQGPGLWSKGNFYS